MTYAEVKTMLTGITVNDTPVPNAYYQFPNNTEQAPPFICFFYSYSNDILADDKNYQKVEHLVIELYTDNKDFTLEAAVEAALNNAGLVYSRDEEYLDDERMMLVVFETDVVITAAAESEETNG